MKKISTWHELDGLESDNYKITVDTESGCGWINPIVETEETLGEKYYDHHMYLSTHTFYERQIGASNKLLKNFGFDVELITVHEKYRQELIDKLRSIITDLENGYDGFMYLYDVLLK